MKDSLNGISRAIALVNEVITLLSNTSSLSQSAENKNAIDESLLHAKKASDLAEIQIAEALGYELCKCTFPPQIMLSQGYTEVRDDYSEEYICPRCKKSSIAPPPRRKKMHPRFPRKYKRLR